MVRRNMKNIPFLQPNLVKQESFSHYLSQIEKTRKYSNYGPLNTMFEDRVLAEYFEGNGGALTVNNATIGLMLAISGTRRKEGRYAIMPSFTFSATPLAAMWCGLETYFIDVDKDSWCMDESLLEEALDLLGDETAVVVPYATFGTNLDLDYYVKLHRSGIPVVIDAAPCFGSMGKEGAFSKGFPGVSVFSFHATKSFGIGEGGLLYSGDAATIQELRKAGNFGFSADRESVQMGLNSKLSEYAAAIALATFDAYPEKVRERQQIYEWYKEAFLTLPSLKNWKLQRTEGSIAHQFMPALCPENENSGSYVKLLSADGIEARTYFSPACHKQKLFSACKKSEMPVTDSLSDRILSLPLWEGMVKEDVERVAASLSKGSMG
ncbi:possible degT/dnrJ/eryC1/strS family protein [Bacillus sp. NRRL B-14911]|nr:possible degT/dnrJ/eryC1/strS family protein [Bacillus sp. NRRL B-14911]